MLKAALYRPVWLLVAIALTLLVASLGLLAGTAWRSLMRWQPIETHLEHLSRLQDTGLRIEQVLIKHLQGDTPLTPQALQDLNNQIAALMALETHLLPDTSQSLRAAHEMLNDPSRDPKEALTATLAVIQKVRAAKLRAYEGWVKDVHKTAEMELMIALGTGVALPLLGALTVFALRRRILLPLRNLSELMVMLARQDYRPAPVHEVDPLLKPLIASYNAMVGRLAELEQEHQSRQQWLESQVRKAVRTLLVQQRSLDQAERMAAIGEMAARIAHELRNPLAGVQVALNNLRQEATDPDQAGRLELVMRELARMPGLLNGLLDRARHTPEPVTKIRLKEAVHEVLALARYQLPDGLQMEEDIPEDLVCRLPRESLHQALLNLVLNARDAIGDRAGMIGVRGRAEADTLTLEVFDDGPGFAQELLDSGIRPFASGRAGGTGLGLAMVQRFAQSLSGQLRLQNRSPRGASVMLILPCMNHYA